MLPPDTHEYDPYYAGYIAHVAGDDIFTVLDSQPADLRASVIGKTEDFGTYSYAEGKWTVKQLLSHIIDGERIFAYRVLRISRGDETPIEGFEQDDYIETSNANTRTFADLLEEFELERRANILMFRNISDEGARRIGIANGKEISARALVYIMAGHVRHHLNVLQERYFA